VIDEYVLVVLAKTCWIYELIYVSSNVWCYKCVKKMPLLMISLWSSVAWSWQVLGKYGSMIIIP